MKQLKKINIKKAMKTSSGLKEYHVQTDKHSKWDTVHMIQRISYVYSVTAWPLLTHFTKIVNL